MVQKFSELLIGLAIGMFIFFILYGAFGGTVLDNLNTIATHDNMTTDGATAIENAFTMYGLIGFIVLVVIVIALLVGAIQKKGR